MQQSRTISEYSNRYALDATDKNKIANSVYEEHCTLKAWEQRSYEQVATSYKVYVERQKRLEQTRLADIERETERKTLVTHMEQLNHYRLKAGRLMVGTGSALEFKLKLIPI